MTSILHLGEQGNQEKKPCSVNKGDDFMLEVVITAELLQLTKKQSHATQPHLSYQALRIPFL